MESTHDAPWLAAGASPNRPMKIAMPSDTAVGAPPALRPRTRAGAMDRSPAYGVPIGCSARFERRRSSDTSQSPFRAAG